MMTVSQTTERLGNLMARSKVRQAVQAGVIKNIVETEVNAIISEALNERLKAEQAALLGRSPYERVEGSPSRNGFKTTWLPGLFGKLMLRKPVVRRGTVVSPLLRALKRAGRDLRDLLTIRFWLRGASTRAVAEELNGALGTRLSHSTVSTLTNALEPVIREWETRPVPAGIQYLFPDALYLPVRRPGFTKEQAILLALGVDSGGKRHLLGFMLGDRESEDSWTSLLKDLLKRGLDRRALRLVVSDEHKGIEAAVSKVLGVSHQLCVVHKIRNLKARVASPDWKAFLADLNAIYWASNRVDAKRAAGVLQGRWQGKYPKAVTIALNRLDDFLRFMDEPKSLWTLLRTSNLIERFIREMRRRLRPAGAMQSELWGLQTRLDRGGRTREAVEREILEASGTDRESPCSGGDSLMLSSWRIYTPKVDMTSIYTRAHAVLSFECHSPIIAAANGTPFLYLRQPEDTIKGQMYYDLGFADWTFEIEQTGKSQVADRLRAMGSDYPRAKAELGSGMERIGRIYTGSTATIRRLLDAER